MRILLSSLQVSQGASNGHLHPAIEIGLELKRRGHHVAILPLPSPFSKKDKEQINRCQFEIIEPPPLPQGLPLSPQELGQLAKNQATTSKAYHSFLIAPLEYQFEKVMQKIKSFSPDIVVYDLLVYAVPLAARLLNIPDMGYCAGLKLIAPSSLTTIYQSIYKELAPSINDFLKNYSLSAEFHDLELLSSTYQLVFTPEILFEKNKEHIPRRTIFAGSLPISTPRCEETSFDFPYDDKNFIVLCFGSVLDPANYPDLTTLIVKTANQFKQHLIINTQNPHFFSSFQNISVAPYLPLPQLLKKASIVIHHGGASTFSECLTIGAPQILIPLTTDQPIQADVLRRSEAGISIHPNEITEENLYHAFQRLLNSSDPIHQRIRRMREIFQQSTGAVIASDFCSAILDSRTLQRKQGSQ